jgi:hypothetical protein
MGCDPPGELLWRQAQHRVVRSTGLEGTHFLQVFAFEKNLAAGLGVDEPAGHDRGAVHVGLDPLGCCPDVIDGDTIHWYFAPEGLFSHAGVLERVAGGSSIKRRGRSVFNKKRQILYARPVFYVRIAAGSQPLLPDAVRRDFAKIVIVVATTPTKLGVCPGLAILSALASRLINRSPLCLQ